MTDAGTGKLVPRNRYRTHRMHWLRLGVFLGLFAALALGGCGKKGPLYLPDSTAAAAAGPVTAAGAR